MWRSGDPPRKILAGWQDEGHSPGLSAPVPEWRRVGGRPDSSRTDPGKEKIDEAGCIMRG